MDALGIGNAIIDVICKVSEDFIKKNNLTKGAMKLVNENDFKKILNELKISETISGGSVANSIVGLAQLGNNVGFIGKVNNDDFGKKYEEGLKKEKVAYHYKKKIETFPTGACLVLITPDAERTMCTFLGIAGKIDENDINVNIIRESKITFLEGYLWDEGKAKSAFNKAIKYSNITAMTLSDLFCVERHKQSFLDLIKNKLDIIFANEQEMISLIDAKSIEEVVSFCKEQKKLFVITRGSDGALSIENNNIFECPIQQNLKILDLTGAGDLFAAGFLHGYINNKSENDCLELGTEMSSKVIQILGARL